MRRWERRGSGSAVSHETFLLVGGLEMTLKLVDRIVTAAAVVCLVASTVMILANVFYRYVVLDWLRGWSREAEWLVPLYDALNRAFGAVSVTADEVPGYLLVWIAFLGAYLALRRDGHIGFDLLILSLPARAHRVLRIATEAAILAFLGLLLWQSLRMIRVDGATEIETAEIAQGWFMAVLPIAALLLALPIGLRLLGRLHGENSNGVQAADIPPTPPLPLQGGGSTSGATASSSPLEGDDRGGG